MTPEEKAKHIWPEAVKLNNPLMGTETARCMQTVHTSALRLKLN